MQHCDKHAPLTVQFCIKTFLQCAPFPCSRRLTGWWTWLHATGMLHCDQCQQQQTTEVSHRDKHVPLRVKMRAEIPLQYAVLPAFMRDDQSELCTCNVARQGHELLCWCELVEVWASQIVRSLGYWKGFLYKVFGDTLHQRQVWGRRGYTDMHMNLLNFEVDAEQQMCTQTC